MLASRAERRRARQRAPRHPPGPEARVRLTVARLLNAYHRHVKAIVLRHVTRRDAQHLRLHAGLTSAHSVGAELLKQSRLRDTAKKAAATTTVGLVRHLSDVLDLDGFDPDLGQAQLDYAERVVSGVEAKIALSVERAQDILDEWEDLDPETSPRAGDPAALAGMLDDGLDGVLGGALAWGATAFGDLFAELNRTAQEEAGVAEYVWMSQHDSRVRPEHAALDGEVCSWDDPPLGADESSSGEECHAGEDVNCRCVASPRDVEETGEEEAAA